MTKFLRFPGNRSVSTERIRFDGPGHQVSFYVEGRGRRRMGQGRQGRVPTAQASCEKCFFSENELCAVSGSGPCATFRPAGPDGLRPPSQLRFVFRQERRQQVAWAFPSANEQVSRHVSV